MKFNYKHSRIWVPEKAPRTNMAITTKMLTREKRSSYLRSLPEAFTQVESNGRMMDNLIESDISSGQLADGCFVFRALRLQWISS